MTPEDRPLKLFGATASEAVAELLEMHGIALYVDTTATAVVDGSLRVLPDERIEADRVVALPRLEGPRLEGVPHDTNGFVPTDEAGRVRGLTDVYAAGDLTSFPIKQGGIATQQADAAAESIAASAGAPIEPRPFTPVLRGLLLTGLTRGICAPSREAFGPSSTPSRSGGRRRRSSGAISRRSWPPSCTCPRALRRRTANRIAVDVDLRAQVP